VSVARALFWFLIVTLAGCIGPRQLAGISQGGVRLPDNQACSVRVNSDGSAELLSCQK
jgi:hypothetical protein